METPEQNELKNLIEAWYLVSFYSGFGRPLHQLGELRYIREGVSDTATFNLRGTLSVEAVRVLLRCLEDTDFDVLIDSVVIEVSESDPVD